MSFNTTSYLAGIGSVVVVLSTGFAGGYYIANPTRIDPPNRLQRLAAEDHNSKATTPAAAAAKPETVAATTPGEMTQSPPIPTPPPTATQAMLVAQPVRETQPVSPTAVPSVAAKVEAKVEPNVEPKASEVKPEDAKPAEPARNVAEQEAGASPNPGKSAIDKAPDKSGMDKAAAQKVHAERMRAAEAKAAERRRSEARKAEEQKIAEQQRKQRELDVATVAVRRIVRGRDAPDIVERGAPDIVEVDQPEAPARAMPHFSLFGQDEQ